MAAPNEGEPVEDATLNESGDATFAKVFELIRRMPPEDREKLDRILAGEIDGETEES